MNKNKFKKIAAFACTAALTGVLAFSLSACGDNNDNKGDGGDGTNTTQTALQLNKTSVTVKAGESVDVTVTSSTTGNIVWSSSDDSIATVKGSGTGNKLGKITGVKAGTATVTAKDGDNQVTCSVTVEPAANLHTPTNVVFSGEDNYASGWRYWTGDGNATVNSCVNYADNNETNIKYNFVDGLSYSVQLFYKDFKTTGVTHDVSLTIVSDVAANITVNGKKTELIVGENQVEVKGEDAYAGSTLSVQFGVWDENIVSGVHEFTFKDLVVTSHAEVELNAPSFEYASATKVITITDDNAAENVEKYELGVFANATDEMPAYVVDVTGGEPLAMPKVPSGSYTIKLRAVNSSATVLSSPWSENSVELNWTNDKTPLTYSEQKDIADGSNTWYYWNRTWDPVCSFEACYLENGIIKVVGLTNNAAENWSFQLFYKGTTGKKFNITVTASNAGNITVGGVMKPLEANTAVTFNDVDATNLGIQFGGGDASNNLLGDIELVIVEG